MITKTEIKLFKSLANKKFRLEHNLFLVEGAKSVEELLKHENSLSGYPIQKIMYSKAVKAQFEGIHSSAEEVDSKVIDQISSFSNPQQVIAICDTKNTDPNWSALESSVHLYLSSIRDPGNLGTIIRLADWFGMAQIFCSEDTVDFYNSKVIQASMGSFCRVRVHYLPFEDCINKMDKAFPIYAAALNGSDIKSKQLYDKGLLLIGNEANGLSSNELNKATHLLRIPGPFKEQGPESLNAAMATSILLSAFKKIV
jgi:RNA methyltransferase, TrmH family